MVHMTLLILVIQSICMSDMLVLLVNNEWCLLQFSFLLIKICFFFMPIFILSSQLLVIVSAAVVDSSIVLLVYYAIVLLFNNGDVFVLNLVLLSLWATLFTPIPPFLFGTFIWYSLVPSYCCLSHSVSSVQFEVTKVLGLMLWHTPPIVLSD